MQGKVLVLFPLLNYLKLDVYKLQIKEMWYMLLLKFRSAIEYEKKGYAENYEHGQVMERNLVSMARELEKLRAEIANAEKRAHAATAVGNPGMICFEIILMFLFTS